MSGIFALVIWTEYLLEIWFPHYLPFESFDALKVVKDSDVQYYGFVLKLNSGGLFRLNFGADLSSSPIPESLGSLRLGGASDMEFVEAQGIWYALVASGSNLFRLKFTSGLGGASETVASVNLGNFGGLINSARGLALVKRGSRLLRACYDFNLEHDNDCKVCWFNGRLH